MTRRLRVLTYNVQMRSWGMEVGAQDSLTPVTSVEKRANAIASRILAATEPWDLLCFNEVFDEDGLEILDAGSARPSPTYALNADADDRGPAIGRRRVRVRNRRSLRELRSAFSAAPRCCPRGGKTAA